MAQSRTPSQPSTKESTAKLVPISTSSASNRAAKRSLLYVSTWHCELL
jgi:hypothetical protein